MKEISSVARMGINDPAFFPGDPVLLGALRRPIRTATTLRKGTRSALSQSGKFARCEVLDSLRAWPGLEATRVHGLGSHGLFDLGNHSRAVSLCDQGGRLASARRRHF